MRDKAIVVSVSEKNILVKPLLTGACINCKKSSCAKQGTPFAVSNPQHFPVKAGSIVTLTAGKAAQSFQALFALLLPIASSIAGYLAAPENEKSRAIWSIAGFILATVIVFAVTRLFPPQKSSIASVEEADCMTSAFATSETHDSAQAESCTLF